MKKLFLIISTLILFNSSTYSMSGDAPDPSNPIFKVNNKEYKPTEPNFTAEIGVLEDATLIQLDNLLSNSISEKLAAPSVDISDPNNPTFTVAGKIYTPAEIGALDDATAKQLGELLSDAIGRKPKEDIPQTLSDIIGPLLDAYQKGNKETQLKVKILVQQILKHAPDNLTLNTLKTMFELS